MADLQETLNKRERRSRIVAFVVGLGVILVLVVLFIVFTSDDGNEANTNEGENTEQVADAENGNEDVFDVFEEEGGETSSDSTTEGSDENAASGEDGEVAGDSSETNSEASEAENEAIADTGDDDSELPNTGPVETTIVGLFAVLLAGFYFVRSQQTLKNVTLNK